MKEENPLDNIKEIFTDYLKRKKHRKTPERYAILECIFSLDGHFDAEYIYKNMYDDYRVSLATVYNTLEILLDCGLIVKHQFGSQQAQYEKTFGNAVHHHIICTKCGKIKEFSDKKIRYAIQSRSFANFHSSHYSLNIYGLCNKCKNAKN